MAMIAFAKAACCAALLALLTTSILVEPTGAYSYSSPRSSTGGGPPSWTELERRLPSSLVPGPAVYGVGGDAIPDDADLRGKTVLYRDANGWCPRCEQAWLALEVKGIDYVTVLVDGGGEGDGGAGCYDNPGTVLPRVAWPDGTVHVGSGDMLPFLEKVEEVSPPGSSSPAFFPDISAAVDIVRTSIDRRFDGVMPRYTRPSGTAPYVYRVDKAAEEGEVVQRFKYQVTLEEIEEMLEEYDDGPFIAGRGITAADIFWAPFLERFVAHLPLLHDNLQPRSAQYEAIQDWYDAMDALPCYSCRVKGRGETWRRVLRAHHPDLDLTDASAAEPPIDVPTKKSFKPDKIWSRYADEKPYLASTPAGEAAARIVRDRDTIAEAASTACGAARLSDESADAALRELCDALVSSDGGDPDAVAMAAAKLSGDAREVAAYLDGGGGGIWEVPRDIGVLPAEALRALASAAPKPRI